MAEKKGNILIVDDNQSILDSLEITLKYHFGRVLTLKNPERIKETLRNNDIDIVLLDMNFTAGINSGNEGLFWLKEIKKEDASILVIFITAYGDIELAVKGIREGARDFILKPWDNEKLIATLQTALSLRTSQREVKRLQIKNKALQDQAHKGYEIIGRSPAMLEVLRMVEKVATTDANVLILGENGTGKELIARKIHKHSKRHKEVFVSVDLGSLSEPLFESEMFGHVKGAFTDAKENRTGRFVGASGGTLFLDEIGNLGLPSQAKLLTALEQRKVIPVGSNKECPVDIRLICATNKDPEDMIKQGIFREDLLYRINTVQIVLPPLRERKEDIALLVNHYLRIFAQKYEKGTLRLNQSAMDCILSYSWPGNIRELKHSMERAVILAESPVLNANDFNLSKNMDSIPVFSTNMTLEQVEKQVIANALKNNQGNISETARELNIGRQTLYRKIKQYGL